MSKRDRRARMTGKASSPMLRHVRLHHYLLRSDAWRALGCYSRAALVEIYALYNGQNNSEIGMSERRLAELLNCSRATARQALRQLVECGFIRIAERGSFHRKIPHATCWRLTEFPTAKNALPTKEFTRWTPPSNRGTGFSRVCEIDPPGMRDRPAINSEGEKSDAAGL